MIVEKHLFKKMNLKNYYFFIYPHFKLILLYIQIFSSSIFSNKYYFKNLPKIVKGLSFL